VLFCYLFQCVSIVALKIVCYYCHVVRCLTYRIYPVMYQAWVVGHRHLLRELPHCSRVTHLASNNLKRALVVWKRWLGGCRCRVLYDTRRNIFQRLRLSHVWKNCIIKNLCIFGCNRWITKAAIYREKQRPLLSDFPSHFRRYSWEFTNRTLHA